MSEQLVARAGSRSRTRTDPSIVDARANHALPAVRPPQTVSLCGMSIARLDGAGLLDHVFASLARGCGGWLITANLDFVRRFARDPAVRALYTKADLCVADGMPIVWASRMRGEPLPERVTGSTLIWTLPERAEREQRSLYLLGGEPGAAAGTAAAWARRWPGVRVVGCEAPHVSEPPTAGELAAIRERVVRAAPDILLVGLGSPKQEMLIDALRADLPRCWMIGVGVSFSFAAGKTRRAPLWQQRAGLEWVHRMAQDPRRLARRYLIDDLPFAFVLFTDALLGRSRRAALGPSTAR